LHSLLFQNSILNNKSLASETLREVPLNFKKFYSAHKYIDPNWLYWLIGFIEGDGNIYTSNEGRLILTITQKEAEPLEEIKQVLGFGSVNYDKSSNCYRFKVQDNEGIYLLCLLLNGNLVQEHRINQLGKWVDHLQLKGYDIKLKTTSRIPTYYDAWFSGFTDAEGCFNLHVFKRKESNTGFRVIIRFTLPQRDEKTLLLIKDFIKFGNVSKKKSNRPGLFVYTNTSFTNTLGLVNYFHKFPLKTKKKESFDKWCEIRTMLLNKDHLSVEGLNKIIALGKLINKVNSEVLLKKDTDKLL